MLQKIRYEKILVIAGAFGIFQEYWFNCLSKSGEL